MMMRTRTTWSFLAAALGAAVLACGPICSGEPQPVREEFEAAPAITVYRGEERATAFSIAPAPQARGLSGRIQWGEERFKYAELILPRGYPVFRTEEDAKTIIRLDVFVPVAQPILDFSLRLRDARNETFQLRQPVKLPRPGWHTLEYVITPQTVGESWGDGADRRFDLPVELSGFAFLFNPDNPGKGELWLDNLSIQPQPNAAVPVSRPLAHFDRRDRWRTLGAAAGATLELSPDGSGLALLIPAADKAQELALRERMFELRDIGAPDALRLDYHYDGAAPAQAGLWLTDRLGKTVNVKPLAVQPGTNTLVWTLPAKREYAAPLRLTALQFTIPPTTAGKTRALRLRCLSAESRESGLEAMEIETATGSPLHLLPAEGRTVPALRFTSRAAAPLSFNAEITLEDFFGRQIRLAEQFLLPARQSVEWPLPLIPAAKGIWWVKYDLTGVGNAERRTGKLSFAIMDPAGPAQGRYEGSFILGVCGHPGRWSERDQELEIRAAGLCGARIYRGGLEWNALQPQPEVWNFAAYDKLLALTAQNGMEQQAMFAFSTPWAAAPEKRNTGNWHDWNNSMPDLAAWRTYVETVVKRYHGRVRYWEVWNEPDLDFWLGSADEYLTLLRETYRTVKKIAPDSIVMTGGFAGVDFHYARRDPLFQQKVLQQGQDFFDVHAYHAHGDFVRFQRGSDGPLAQLRAGLRSPKPLFYNETAVASPDDAQHFQAQTLFKKVVFAKARGAIGYQWYDLRNDGFDAKDHEHNFGLVTTDFYPKAAYVVFNTIARHFLDKEPAGQLALPDNCWGFAFANAQEQLLAVWSEGRTGAEEQVILLTDAQEAWLLDLMDNRTPLTLAAGKAILPIRQTPATVVLRGAQTAPQVRGALIGAPHIAAAVPGRTASATVMIRNPGERASRVALEWYLPAGLTAQQELPATADLPPGGTADFPVVFAVDAAAGAGGARTRLVQIFYAFADLPFAGRLDLPVPLATLARRDADRAPDFTLERRDQVFNLCEALPSTAHLVWKGKEDLGAHIWLTRGEGALKLRVRVSDDRHRQPFSGSNLWNADSLQFALAVPGQKGYWEVGLARHDDGKPEVFVWQRPDGIADPAAATALTTTPYDGGLLYEAMLPYAAYGLSDALLAGGIKFNLIVNDRDENVREGWIQLAPGIGDTKNPEPFPFVVFE